MKKGKCKELDMSRTVTRQEQTAIANAYANAAKAKPKKKVK